MSDEKLSKLMKEAKLKCMEHFKGKTIGEMTNSKNTACVAKMKNEFKNRNDVIKKKNIDCIKKVSYSLFENLMQMSI